MERDAELAGSKRLQELTRVSTLPFTHLGLQPAPWRLLKNVGSEGGMGLGDRF